METLSINEKQDQIVDEFSLFDEWMDKYDYLISLGKDLEPMPQELKSQQNLIDGCQSRLWLHAELKKGKISFLADSDAIITKGIVALLISVLNERAPNEILENELYFIDKIGLKEHLSPTRSNGLLAMMKQMKMYALAFQHKIENE